MRKMRKRAAVAGDPVPSVVVDLADADLDVDRVDLDVDRVDLGVDRVDRVDRVVDLPLAAAIPASIKEPEIWHRFQNVLNTASRNAATGEAMPAVE